MVSGAKELGFSLKEIQELLILRVDPETTCVDMKRRTEAKIAAVERKIEDLSRIKQALVKAVGLCSGDGALSACPILETLDANPFKRSSES